ncbi:MAG: (2Fe-2S)-binding protein [Spirochaetales bacterium]|nr:MAG: (2Fe-2S)-binding protein [Spirochaetales bacterium]
MANYNLTVNGVSRTVDVDPKTPLLHVLRRNLGLTGSKQGCDNGVCGACTVVVNGKAVKSCVFPISKAADAVVVTVEGVAKGMVLHPIQRALIDSGAVQCGFCTPGIVMELYALFLENPDPGEAALVKALNKHLCRCTGYEAIMDGARFAVTYLAQGSAQP